MNTWLRTVLGIGLLLTLFACEIIGGSEPSQTSPEPEPLPDSVSQAYREDARQLAVRKMVEEESERVEIKDTYEEWYHNALAYVYNAEHIQARDSIIGIHTFPRYNLHEVIVGVDSSAPWTQAWRKGNRLTGNESVDTLLQEYTLTLEDYLEFAPAAVLRSERALNPVALSAMFEGIDGVRYAEQNGYAGDSDDIRAENVDDAVRLRYSRAWGDCPAGCIHRTTWTFRVDNDGTVSFVGKTSE